jgi:potassium efflux system protein
MGPTPAAESSVSARRPVTLATVLLALLIFSFAFVASKNVPGLLEILLLRRLRLDAGARYASTTLVRYAIAFSGTAWALGTLGIGWSSIQWLAAALTFGLGFGLQEIFANFVSGIIILTERPVRLGDVVTIGETTGSVTHVQIRATTITDWDGKELIVPNRVFVTGNVVNWSRAVTLKRITVPVGVASDSDTAVVQAKLLEVARDHRRVLAAPKPLAVLVKFGESTLDFELRVFTPELHPARKLAIQHELISEINTRLLASGIEIAFPQRDVRIRQIPPLTLPTPPAKEEPPSGDAPAKGKA